MFTDLIKKLGILTFAGAMMLGTSTSTSVMTQWPDVGYSHIPYEDKTYKINAEILSEEC
ncbi:MAG: hypothetical protein HUJ53_03510 [Holdemanella sp.]|nr:hypothetical protein [Holdemanella sp.]